MIHCDVHLRRVAITLHINLHYSVCYGCATHNSEPTKDIRMKKCNRVLTGVTNVVSVFENSVSHIDIAFL